jgi:hypothetical protein
MSTSSTVRAWSTTDASNASSDSNITSADTQSPDTLDNNIRSVMAAVRKLVLDVSGNLVAGGSANALTVTTNCVLESGQLVDGLFVKLKATADNTNTTVTFAPDGLTAANIKRADGSALAVGDIRNGMYLDLVYNSGSSEWRASNITIGLAAQADQETATSTALAVTPGRQQFHPSAAKCWAFVTVSGGVPTLAASYNITSITDSGVGDLTITIATDFSSANWAGLATVSAAGVQTYCYESSKSAGSVEYAAINAVSADAVKDPGSWSFAGFGDQ